jgi:predicted AAA+ superfamily ATPase
MRYIAQNIKKDLKKKMVFLGGPRQCGKTTLAKSLLKLGRYFNWDYDQDRQDILAQKWAPQDQLLIFDELHKFSRWKNWIKGLFDVQKDQHQFLVTGSARLDVYRKGGDSLLGRYHYWRLHPFSLSELPLGITKEDAFDRLMRVGGFPEPFLDNNEQEARRWRKERLDRVVREDIRDLESIQNIQNIFLLIDLLRSRVGGPIVVSHLAQDLQVSSHTVKHWIEILEKMYLIFIVKPYSKSLVRALQKPFKVYFFDNADILNDQGARFENLVATHLLKYIHYKEDSEGYRYQLWYIRDKEGREVDFLITKDNQIEQIIEAKLSDESVSRHLSYFAERLHPLRATQIVGHLKNPYSKGKIEVLRALDALSQPF